MPCCAAFTSSTRMTSLGSGSSTYQSVSTTPAVCLEDRLDLLGDLGLTSQVGTVNLRHQSLHHRRARRNLADLNARAICVADRIQQRAKPLGNGMALHAALLGRQQVHLNVGLIRLAAHVVVAHQSVEVIGAGCSGIRSGSSARPAGAQVLRPTPGRRARSVRAACRRAY